MCLVFKTNFTVSKRWKYKKKRKIIIKRKKKNKVLLKLFLVFRCANISNKQLTKKKKKN